MAAEDGVGVKGKSSGSRGLDEVECNSKHVLKEEWTGRRMVWEVRLWGDSQQRWVGGLGGGGAEPPGRSW